MISYKINDFLFLFTEICTFLKFNVIGSLDKAILLYLFK